MGITVVVLTAEAVKLVIAEEKSSVKVPVLAVSVLPALSLKLQISGAIVFRRITLAAERWAGLTTEEEEGELTLLTLYAVVDCSAFCVPGEFQKVVSVIVCDPVLGVYPHTCTFTCSVLATIGPIFVSVAVVEPPVTQGLRPPVAAVFTLLLPPLPVVV